MPSSTRLLLLTDRHRSVIGSMASGRSAYDPFGSISSNAPHASRFTGEHQDQLTGTYLLGNGYRAYSPVLRRFLSPDSYSPFSHGLINAYAYCGAEPVNNTDPSGHMPKIDVGEFSDDIVALIFNTGKAKREMRALPKSIDPTDLQKFINLRGLIKVQELEDTITINDSIIASALKKPLSMRSPDIQPIKLWNAKHRPLLHALNARVNNKPAMLVASDAQLGLLPGVNSDTGQWFMESALEIHTGTIGANAHRGIRRFMQNNANNAPDRWGPKDWILESIENNKLIRNG